MHGMGVTVTDASGWVSPLCGSCFPRRLSKGAGGRSKGIRQLVVSGLQPRIRVHGKSHQTDLPQVDLGQMAMLATAVGFNGSIADGETVERTGFQKRGGFGSALDVGQEAAI